MAVRLSGEALPRPDLTHEHIRRMFELFQDHYENAAFDTFERDLNAKNWVILLRDRESDSIQGFSTLAFYQSLVDGDPLGVVYSGDTVIRPDYWGTFELPRTWIRAVMRIGAGLSQPLYWLLISSGYKTYRFLPVFFEEFYPRYDRPTPSEVQQLIHHLAGERFGSEYHPGLGIVRFSDGATPLRPEVAQIGEKRLKDPHVAFFVEKNPGHVQGDELVCLTRIHPDNFAPAGLRMMR